MTDRWSTELRTEIEIEASRATVWRTLIDFDKYVEWNPALIKVTTSASPGSRVRMTFCTSTRQFELNARVITADSGRELRWLGPVSRLQRLLFSGEHYWRLEEGRDDESCRLVHGEVFRGISMPLVSGWLQREIVPAYEDLNQALKQRAEED